MKTVTGFLNCPDDRDEDGVARWLEENAAV